MKAQRARYQQGSIRRVERSNGFKWEVRFSEMKDGKRHQRTLLLDGVQYPTEKAVRRAIELNVSQVNAGTGAVRADAKWMDVCALYPKEHLPTLAHSSRSLNEYLLDDYIEAHFGHKGSRRGLLQMRPLP